MNTLGEIRTRVKRELQLVSTSTIFTDATLNDYIWDAYIWTTSRHVFPKLLKAIATTTTAGAYYYDYPIEFRSETIVKIVIDGKNYEPKDFEDYLLFKENNPNQTHTRIFASYGNQYFVEPTPTSTDLQIIAWGSIQPQRPVDANFDAAKTVFSDSEVEMNEGVMRKSLSDLLGTKSKFENKSDKELVKAQAIVDGGFAKIQQRRYIYQRKDAPFFKAQDFFAMGKSSALGNFNR